MYYLFAILCVVKYHHSNFCMLMILKFDFEQRLNMISFSIINSYALIDYLFTYWHCFSSSIDREVLMERTK